MLRCVQSSMGSVVSFLIFMGGNVVFMLVNSLDSYLRCIQWLVRICSHVELHKYDCVEVGTRWLLFVLVVPVANHSTLELHPDRIV